MTDSTDQSPASEQLVERSYCATARKRKAAKAHRCESCSQVIPKGEHYVLHTGFPGHDALSDITAPMRMAECWRCASRYGRDYLLGRDIPAESAYLPVGNAPSDDRYEVAPCGCVKSEGATFHDDRCPRQNAALAVPDA